MKTLTNAWLVILTFIFISNFSYSQTWEWATQLENYQNEYIYFMDTDHNDNVVICGTHYIYNPEDSIYGTYYGSYDIYIDSYSNTGELLQHKSFGNYGNESPLGMKIATDGTIYLYMQYSDSTTIDNQVIYDDDYSTLLAQFDQDINLINYTKIQGGLTYAQPGLFFDTDDNLVISGDFYQSITIGSQNYTTDSYGIYISQINNELEIFKTTILPIDNDSINFQFNKIININESEVTVLFNYSSYINYQPSYGLLINKHDFDGALLNSIDISSEDYVAFQGISNELNGQFSVSGFSSYDITINDIKLSSLSNDSLPIPSGFVCSFDNELNLVWANRINSTAGLMSFDAKAFYNNFYSVGCFMGDIDFNGITVSGTNSYQASPGYGTSIYIVKYLPNGEESWIANTEGDGMDEPFRMTISKSGKFLYVTGKFANIIEIGDDILEDISLGNAFIAKLADNDTIYLGEDSSYSPYMGSDLFTIYPNPSSSYLNLEMNKEQIQDLRLDIIDNNGQVIAKHIINSTHTQIDVSNLPSAVYYFNLNSSNGNKIERVVIQ